MLQGIRHGMSNGAIARRRGVSRDAVKFHVENIRLKLGAQTRGELRAFRGQPMGTRLGEGSSMANAHVNLGPIAQISFSVTEIERAVAFYRDTLGLPHLFTAGKLAFFDCGGTRLMLDALEEAQGKGNSVLYFAVADINAAQDALTAAGVHFEGAPHLIFTHPDGKQEWLTFFRDPDGNLLSLKSEVLP